MYDALSMYVSYGFCNWLAHLPIYVSNSHGDGSCRNWSDVSEVLTASTVRTAIAVFLCRERPESVYKQFVSSLPPRNSVHSVAQLMESSHPRPSIFSPPFSATVELAHWRCYEEILVVLFNFVQFAVKSVWAHFHVKVEEIFQIRILSAYFFWWRGKTVS